VNKFSHIKSDVSGLTKEHKFIVATFSGGKDSTALAFTLLNALARSRYKPEKVWLIYVNTLVEPPPLLQTAQKSLTIFQSLSARVGSPIETVILTPELKDRFWVLLIGKGYPPPSVRFRWCSDRLKIRPVKNFLRQIHREIGDFPLVLTGVREQEGSNRKKNLSKRVNGGKWMNYEGLKDCLVYAPLLYLNDAEVWDYIGYNEEKWKVGMHHLREIYSMTSGDTNGFRTGCWVCTLVKRDKSLEKLAENQNELEPLIEFRHSLLSIRDNMDMRVRVQKNGKSYLGPLNHEAREDIYHHVRKVWNISSEEDELIQELWQKD
jgi:DNA sulfur modification protein DndC